MTFEWLRTAEWLHAQRIASYLRLIAVLNLAAVVLLVATSQRGIDANGFLLGTDFISFWTASRLSHLGSSAYDVAAHVALQRQTHAPPASYTAFFYPPPFLLYCWPLGWLAYFPALALWLGVTGAGYTLAVRAWLGRLPWWAIAAFPPVLITITHGQSSFLLAGLLGGGVWLVAQGRSTLGGILFGLAVFKPQFGVLLPMVLLASREWRALLAAALTALALALAATAVLGVHIWGEWWAVTGAAQAAMANGSVSFAKLQSLFAALRLLGVPIAAAYIAQFALTCGIAAILARLAWRRGFTLELGAATLAGTVLATPFVLDYDLVLLAFPIALLAVRPSQPWERSAAAMAFITPVFARSLAAWTGAALMVPVGIWLFAVLVRRAAAPVPSNLAANLANGGRSKD